MMGLSRTTAALVTRGCRLPQRRTLTLPRRRKSTLEESRRKEHVNGTQWPSSFSDFVAGTPIVTPKLPYFGRTSFDFGTLMMNVGAITSLGGFCMTDVLLLRSLSILGSLCGITYNVTRVPKQLNAVAWGCIFVGVNVVQIVRLLKERALVKFSVEEGELYYRLFAPFGVEPHLFYRLLKLAEWKTYEKGQVIVESDKPLKHVHLLVHGMASAWTENDEILYTYSATDNGCIIGATAVVDPTVLGRSYPNKILACEKVRAVSFDARGLRKFLKENDSSAEAAVLHLMYVDLLGALRRDRKLGEALQELKSLLQKYSESGVVDPKGRRTVREFLEDHKITDMQFKGILQSVGWTVQEWKDGAKHSSQVFHPKESTGIDCHHGISSRL